MGKLLNKIKEKKYSEFSTVSLESRKSTAAASKPIDLRVNLFSIKLFMMFVVIVIV